MFLGFRQMTFGKIFLLFLFGTFVAGVAVTYNPERSAQQDLEALLSGSENIGLIAVEVPSENLVLEDPESLQYLSTMFRAGKRGDWSGGIGFEAVLKLSTGGHSTQLLHVEENKSEISLALLHDGDVITYMVPLLDALPKPLVGFLTKLRSRK